MRVSLRLLRYFAATAETGSTTAAARLLNVSQPSISVAIRELEKHGVRAALLAAIESARDRSVELGRQHED